jgi:signal transduction histidine kinase
MAFVGMGSFGGPAPVEEAGGDLWAIVAVLAIALLLGALWMLRRLERSLAQTRKAMAERIGEATRRLETKNAELAAANEELHRANRELEQQRALVERSARFAAMGEMAAGLAHEINNPLTTMKNLVHSLRPTVPDEDIRGRDLAVVAEEIEKLNRLVVNFLKYARPPKANIRPMDVAGLVHDTIKLLEHQANHKQLSFVSSVDLDLPLALADREQLGQVLVNLVLNAIQASPEGGEVRVSASAEVADEGDEPRAVQISVTDQGPGVSEESREKVFNPFFTTKANGSGLGLAISQRIVEEHAGTLTLSSVFGEGATFVVTLSRLQEVEDEPDSDRR